MGQNGEPDLVNTALIEAAATEPLIESGEQAAFDADSFFQTALRIAQAEGRA